MIGRVRSAFAVVLTACGRLSFDHGGATDAAMGADGVASDASGIQPIHLYELNGTYADTFGGPSLVGNGGTFTADGYQFGVNQGLFVDNAVPSPVYTIDIVFAFADVASWQKVLDYRALAVDEGLYIYEGALQFVIVPGTSFLSTAATITADQRIRVTLTRDASRHVVGYLDRMLAVADRVGAASPPTSPTGTFEFDDTANAAQPGGTRVNFFTDDTPTGMGEAAPGTVRRIAVYDIALTASQVAALP